MKKYFAKASLAVVLAATLAISGCTAAQWVSTIDTILTAAAPALLNILNIIAISRGTPINAALESKITGDAATIKALSGTFATASAAAAPTACAQLQAAINTYSADEAQVMSLAQVSDPVTQVKIETLSALVAGTVTGILAVIPNCQQAAAMKVSLAKTAPPLPLRSFVDAYNTELVKPTGTAAVDKFTKAHKVHGHSAFLRIVSLGHAY